MVELTDLHCEACEEGSPSLSATEIEAYRMQVPAWQVVARGDVRLLEREYKFRNFADALLFTNRVGGLAEAENHHPTIVTEWGKVKVNWWTHSIGGLHQNDFIMAAKTDRLYE
jgi:4a-hydroxytetrahydrobiopterin dehydratase